MIDKILSGFSALKDLLVSGFEKILEFFEFLISFFGSILDYLLSWFGSIWNKLLELVYSLVSPLGDSILAVVPDVSSYWGSNPFPGQALGYLNTWVNLDLAITLLGLWFTWMVVFISIKLSLKLFVPGIG